jgi:hypothetical protein
MRKNVKKVIDAFIKGKPALGDAKKTISTDGKNIYSYKMLIATKLDFQTVALIPYASGPSQTTRSQIRALETELKYSYAIKREFNLHTIKLEPGDLVKLRPGRFNVTQLFTAFIDLDKGIKGNAITALQLQNQIGEIYMPSHYQPPSSYVWWPGLNCFIHLTHNDLLLIHKASKS